MLGFDAEQEARSKRVDLRHARRPFRFFLHVWKVIRLEVAVRECYEPPYYRKAQPGEKEAQREHDQCPPPLGVDQGREYVLEESQSSS